MSGPGKEQNTMPISVTLNKGYTELGYIYYSGWGVASDKKKAAAYLEKGVAQGNTDAKFLLGQLYFYGESVDRDYKRSYDLLNGTVDERYLESEDAINMYTANILGICRSEEHTSELQSPT